MIGDLEAVAALAAAVAAGLVLVAADPRRRALALLGAPLLAALALVLLVGGDLADTIGDRPAFAAGGAAAGAVVVAALAVAIAREPAALPILVVALLPFRVPISVGDDTANLLVPLYAVIAAGGLAFAFTALRGAAPPDPAADPRLRRLRIALAVVLVLYAGQTLYSDDTEQAVKNVCFFYVPFALLFRLLLDVRWSRRLLLAAFGITVGLALVFAAVGFFEYATGRLLISNAKVLEANELKPYFRVNSLFFDPNIYGRYLALTMVALATVLLWTRRSVEAALVGAALAVLWAGLVLSLSQSSFAALVVGLAVLAALRWRFRPVLAAAGVALVASVAVIAFAGGAVGVETDSERALDRATSGRIDLVDGAIDMIGDRPVWGFGSGSFAEVYREREDVRDEDVAAISHTIPLTVTAEQGVVGLAAYVVLLWLAFGLLFAGVRDVVRRAAPGVPAVARAAIAAAFAGLVVHTLVYASFLEDPLTWTLLAVAAALRLARDEPAADDDEPADDGAPLAAAAA